MALGGSHAYGTNHADSDYDIRGVYRAPTGRAVRTGRREFREARELVDDRVGLSGQRSPGGCGAQPRMCWRSLSELNGLPGERGHASRTVGLDVAGLD
ncbi:nucleotidyltransferase domain-containing protein [Candidatus Nephthysia bennettiae]|uniref:Nucleotidyltransferase domain-containing protein n=1 Tax=Candidatus Nephthysia bennettiae TaxID=3127016 RepID=A0A934N502_9BACT|nr:nucleotidyltransferase domain-containing protein [Candidatus Dormibacteraeota bacterium]